MGFFPVAPFLCLCGPRAAAEPPPLPLPLSLVPRLQGEGFSELYGNVVVLMAT